jgi:hypothetical protein
MERHFPRQAGAVPERCGEKSGIKGGYDVDAAMEHVKNHDVSSKGDAGTTVAQSLSHCLPDGHS